MEKVYLVLQSGSVYEGFLLGADTETEGEIVFTTAMTGYMETLTDPSYYGQIVVQTFPMIGNYGAIGEDAESGGVFARGYVVRELCESPSNYRSSGTLDAYLKARGIPCVCGVDTRAVTKEIRESGVMNAKIVKDLSHFPDFASYRVENAVKNAGGKARVAGGGDAKYRVAFLDYGAKENIVRCLVKRGAEVSVFPHDAAAEDILGGGFDGLVLSNGPGDPKENVFEIGELKKLLGRLPIFGICLGHQLLALAAGGDTKKLKYGHRGANQPVKDLKSGRVYITSQNHGYAVDEKLPAGARVTFVNVNDGTVEGVEYEGKNAFTVQFHPEACGGPKDSEGLFDRFFEAVRLCR